MDDIVVFARNVQLLNAMFMALEEAARRDGLQVNETKRYICQQLKGGDKLNVYRSIHLLLKK